MPLDEYSVRRLAEAEVRANVKGTRLNTERYIKVIVDAVTKTRMAEIEDMLLSSKPALDNSPST